MYNVVEQYFERLVESFPLIAFLKNALYDILIYKMQVVNASENNHIINLLRSLNLSQKKTGVAT